MPMTPYIGAHVVAVLYLLTDARWPRIARRIAGAGFIVAGAYNIWTAVSSPSSYVTGFGPHAIPVYRTFIYGLFALHTAACVIAVALGQLAVGIAILAFVRWRKLGYVGAIVFLLAITPLGIGSAAPSTLIFAIAMFLLLRFEAKCSTVPKLVFSPYSAAPSKSH